jgi:HEAT repeat protein
MPSEETDARVRLFEARDRGDVAYLLDALRDPRDRFLAARFLGELKAREAVRPLTQLLRAGDRATRSSAAEALAKIGEAEAVPELIERLRQEEDVVPRTFAITALGKLGDERALKPLCDLLADDDVLVRQSAADALGVLGHPDAVEPLRQAAAGERWYDRGDTGRRSGNFARATDNLNGCVRDPWDRETTATARFG